MNNNIVGLFPNEIFADRKNHGFVKIPHPRTGADGVYLWNKDKKKIYEIQSFSNDRRCWVIDENVIPDPKMYVSNQIDALFLVIPSLINHAFHFTTIDTMTHSDEYPLFADVCCELFHGNAKMEMLADVKVVSESMTVYKFNQEKTLQWLSKKMGRLYDHFLNNRIRNDASLDGDNDHEDAQRISRHIKDEMKATAINIVCDYLTPDLEKIFKDFLNFEDTISDMNMLITSPKVDKRRTFAEDVENVPETKSGKLKVVPKKKASVELKPGQKSILSFFSKAK